MRCAACGSTFTARDGARSCSVACRVRLSRQRPPVELVESDRWVRHVRKRPIRPDGSPASSTNPFTWSSFDAVSASDVGDGVGFVLNGDGIACVDLDDCFHNGRLVSWARDLMRSCPATYVEVSPSGRGLHVFGFAYVAKNRANDGVEVYGRGRYMTVTGRRFSKFPVRLADMSAFVESL